MIRIVKLSGEYLGYQIPKTDDYEKIVKDIQSFIKNGVPVLLVNDFDSFDDFMEDALGTDRKNVEMIKNE